MPRDEVTAVLLEAETGDPSATERLISLLYDELRVMAAQYMRSERPGHTIEPTALVHEAYVRLVDQTRVRWKNRTHFLAVAARSMRRILVDHARRHRSAKRGGGRSVTFVEEMAGHDRVRTLDVLALDHALERLSQVDPRLAHVVELRFFGGLDVEETAATLDISTATVKRDWRFARAWLERELREEGPEG